MAIDAVAAYGAAGAAQAQTASTKKSGSDLTMEDFFKLMAAQLQNQNMMDPVDNTEFIAQMAQFSTLSQMTELSNAVNSTFAVSMIGKTVNLRSLSENGTIIYDSGTVDSITFSEGTAYLEVHGNYYPISNVTGVK